MRLTRCYANAFLPSLSNLGNISVCVGRQTPLTIASNIKMHRSREKAPDDDETRPNPFQLVHLHVPRKCSKTSSTSSSASSATASVTSPGLKHLNFRNAFSAAESRVHRETKAKRPRRHSLTFGNSLANYSRDGRRSAVSNRYFPPFHHAPNHKLNFNMIHLNVERHSIAGNARRRFHCSRALLSRSTEPNR